MKKEEDGKTKRQEPHAESDFTKTEYHVSILSFRRVLYVVCFLLGISPASEV